MSFGLAFKDWPHPSGQILYACVPWDSRVFGFPVYQLSFSEASGELCVALHDLQLFLTKASNGRCLAFVKVSSSDVQLMCTLASEGFYPVETSVEPHRELGSYQHYRKFDQLRLRPATNEDKAPLAAIASRAFSMDRYHLDPNLPADRAGYRYEVWLDNGLRSGEPVFVYEDTRDAKRLGFCHLREVTAEVVDFSLAALDPAFQGTGLGVMMYAECLAECQRRGYGQITTRISVSNIAVLNVYARLGFVFRHPMTTLHWHVNLSG